MVQDKGLAETINESAPKEPAKVKDVGALDKLKELLTPKKPEWKTSSSGIRG